VNRVRFDAPEDLSESQTSQHLRLLGRHPIHVFGAVDAGHQQRFGVRKAIKAALQLFKSDNRSPTEQCCCLLRFPAIPDFRGEDSYPHCAQKVLKEGLKLFLKATLKAVSTPNRLFYEFGQFRLDVAKHRLLRDGEIVAYSQSSGEYSFTRWFLIAGDADRVAVATNSFKATK
jgi:hypothetical protein